MKHHAFKDGLTMLRGCGRVFEGFRCNRYETDPCHSVSESPLPQPEWRPLSESSKAAVLEIQKAVEREVVIPSYGNFIEQRKALRSQIEITNQFRAHCEKTEKLLVETLVELAAIREKDAHFEQFYDTPKAESPLPVREAQLVKSALIERELINRPALVELIAKTGHEADFRGSKMLNSEQNDHQRSENAHAWKTAIAEPMADAVIQFILRLSIPEPQQDTPGQADGVALIRAERLRQVAVEGWSPEHDDEHDGGALAMAASCYVRITKYQWVLGNNEGTVEYRLPADWPREWGPEWWKPSKDPIRNLVKAGALIAAEIDRLQRISEPTPCTGWRGGMTVLLGCEESGVAREAFRLLGHAAWSNDLLGARDGSPYHLQMDVRDAIRSRKWDLIILFPPCTHTCLSGNGTWAGAEERQKGMEFTHEVYWEAVESGAKVALEQPMTMIGRMLGRPTQRVNLWWFGDPETKETWLWLEGLKPLIADRPTDERKPIVHFESPGIRNGLTRSQRRQTLRPGFGRAMAEQWGGTE